MEKIMPRVKLFDKDDVLKKAMLLFWDKGYHATSIQNLVTALGINRGSLYDTFGGKKNLFEQALALYCNHNIKITREFLQSEESVKLAIKKLFQVFIDDSVEDKKGCFVVNTTTELSCEDDIINAALLHNKDNFEAMFCECLKKGQESGEISQDKDIKSLSYMIYVLFSGIRVVARLEKDNQRLHKLSNVVLSLLD